MKTNIELNNKTILVTGSPGFIGSYLVLRLLRELTGGTVISFDCMNDYYEVSLKEWRLSEIEKAAKSRGASCIRLFLLRLRRKQKGALLHGRHGGSSGFPVRRDQKGG